MSESPPVAARAAAVASAASRWRCAYSPPRSRALALGSLVHCLFCECTCSPRPLAAHSSYRQPPTNTNNAKPRPVCERGTSSLGPGGAFLDHCWAMFGARFGSVWSTVGAIWSTLEARWNIVGTSWTTFGSGWSNLEHVWAPEHRPRLEHGLEQVGANLDAFGTVLDPLGNRLEHNLEHFETVLEQFGTCLEQIGANWNTI